MIVRMWESEVHPQCHERTATIQNFVPSKQ